MKIGIIGCGFIAQKHVQSIIRQHDLSLVAVSDTVPERIFNLLQHFRDNLRQEPKAYMNYNDLITDSEVDTVIVAAPSGLHAEIALNALQHGKHVIVEKPMALSTTDAKKMSQVANQTGKHLVVCHQKRFYPHIQYVQRMIKGGVLGKIVYADLSMMFNRNDDYYNAAMWRGTRAMDGGILLNQGIHNIDLLVWLIGLPENVYGQLTRQLRSIETEDTAAAVLTNSDGSIATISATVCAAPSSSVEQISFFGTKGAIVLAGKRFEQVIRWDVDGVEPPSFQPFHSYDGLYQDFYHAVTHKERPLVNGIEGYKTLQTILAIYQSDLKREPIHLPMNEFSVTEVKDVLRGDIDV